MIDSIFKYVTGKVTLRGTTDNGQVIDVPVTPEGHLEVAIHDPLLPFGSLHTESLIPVFQSDAVYGFNTQQSVSTKTLSGSVTANDSMFQVSTGTTILAVASLQSRKRLRYRAGQGIVNRFAGIFNSPTASSYQVMGCGHPEDGYFFGYFGNDFGILKSDHGVREIQDLSITTASITNESATIVLNSTTYSVPITNSGSTLKTAYEIATFASYSGWKAEQQGASVVFLSDSVGNKTGLFDFTATTARGAYTEIRAGTTTVDTFITQTSWNVDPLDGNGPSGATFDPTKNNVYQIGIQYLGAGIVNFKVMASPESANNPTWVNVHNIKNNNILTRTHVSNPSFPFTMAATSGGSTSNITVKCGSYAGFIEGKKTLHGVLTTYYAQTTAANDSTYKAIFTVRNDLVYNGKANQSVISLMNVSAAVKHGFPVTVYMFRNATLAGTPNFAKHSTVSCSSWDTSATTMTFSTNDQLIWTGQLGETGELDHHFGINGIDEVTIQPGETITISTKASSGTPAFVIASLNAREDQ